MVWLRDKEQTFELPEPLNTWSSDWIKMNLNETAYVRVNYAPSNWRALANALQRQHTVKIWLFVLGRYVNTVRVNGGDDRSSVISYQRPEAGVTMFVKYGTQRPDLGTPCAHQPAELVYNVNIGN